jgi:hypothetical protein
VGRGAPGTGRLRAWPAGEEWVERSAREPGAAPRAQAARGGRSTGLQELLPEEPPLAEPWATAGREQARQEGPGPPAAVLAAARAGPVKAERQPEAPERFPAAPELLRARELRESRGPPSRTGPRHRGRELQEARAPPFRAEPRPRQEAALRRRAAGFRFPLAAEAAPPLRAPPRSGPVSLGEAAGRPPPTPRRRKPSTR